MTKFYMTVESHERWVPCEGVTLHAAKIEATRMYNQGYRGYRFHVAVVDDSGQRRLVSTRIAGVRGWEDNPDLAVLDIVEG